MFSNLRDILIHSVLITVTELSKIGSARRVLTVFCSLPAATPAAVELRGFEPLTLALQTRCSPS